MMTRSILVFLDSLSIVGLHVLVRGTVLLTLTLMLTWLLRRHSASLQHAVLTAGTGSLLVLCLAAALVPQWRVLPDWTAGESEAGPQDHLLSVASSEGGGDDRDAFRIHPTRSGVDQPANRNQPPGAVNGETGPTAHAASSDASDVAGLSVSPQFQVAVQPSAFVLLRRLSGIAFLVGSGLFFSGLTLAIVRLRGIANRHRLPAAHPLASELSAISQELGLRTSVQCVLSADVHVPSVAGLWRCCLFLPQAAMQWAPQQRRIVLLHELSHVVRRDPWWQLMTELAGTVFWLHPLYWLARRQSWMSRERACDDHVVAAGVSATDYARCLINVIRHRSGRPACPAAVAMSSATRIECRIRALFDSSVGHRRLRRGVAAGSLLSACLLAVPLAIATVRPNSTEKREPVTSPATSVIHHGESFENSVTAPDVAEGADPVPPTQNDATTDEHNTADSIIWGPDREGLQAGARLLASSSALQPGDPIVVQFLLKNTSTEPKTVVIQGFDSTYPVLGADHRIELNVLGSSGQRKQHTIAPGEILEDRDYRVTVDSSGLPPAEYHVTSNSAFWLSDQDDPNRGTGVPHRRPVPLTIGNPSSVRLTEPDPADDASQTIHWGSPVGGLMVGMRLPDGRTTFSNTARIEPQLFLYNASEQPVTLDYEIPNNVADWNMHLESPDNSFVRLDYTWFTGLEPQISRRITVAPGETLPLTGLEAPVTVGRPPGDESTETRYISGPALQVIPERTEFEYGQPRRLITTSGSYIYHAAVTLHRPEIPDLSLIASAGGIPFEIKAE